MSVQDQECLFGCVADGERVLNDIGRIVSNSWLWLGTQYDHVELDEYVVMPNHLHGVLILTPCRGGSRTAPTGEVRKPVGRLMGAFKTVSTKRVNELRDTPGLRLWQRNYYEHIIRNDGEWNRIREYVIGNPGLWDLDRENPEVGTVRRSPRSQETGGSP